MYLQSSATRGDQLIMEVTIVKSSSEKARGKGNGNGNRGLPIHYNSKSLERPKGAKGSHEVC